MSDQNRPRVLIVDDTQSIRHMISIAFDASGFEVTECSDGASGLTEILKGNYSAILLDLKMPYKDGLEVLKDLQSQTPKEPNGPIIIISNVSYSFARQEALNRGAAVFIDKDALTPDAIVRQVKNLIEKRDE